MVKLIDICEKNVDIFLVITYYNITKSCSFSYNGYTKVATLFVYVEQAPKSCGHLEVGKNPYHYGEQSNL